MLKISFEKGGELIVHLNGDAQKTKQSILEILPLESIALHTRWCGREINFELKTKSKPPMENETSVVSKFDVIYWRDWVIPEEKATEALALFYGAESLRYHKGTILVNVIGRVPYEQEELLEQIGIRIWKNGMEKILIDKVSAETQPAAGRIRRIGTTY